MLRFAIASSQRLGQNRLGPSFMDHRWRQSSFRLPTPLSSFAGHRGQSNDRAFCTCSKYDFVEYDSNADVDEFGPDPYSDSSLWKLDDMNLGAERQADDTHRSNALFDSTGFLDGRTLSQSAHLISELDAMFSQTSLPRAPPLSEDTFSLSLDEEHNSNEQPDGHEMTFGDELSDMLNSWQEPGAGTNRRASSSETAASASSSSSGRSLQGEASDSLQDKRAFVHLLVRRGRLREAVNELAEISRDEEGLSPEDLFTIHEVLRSAQSSKGYFSAYGAYALLTAQPNVQPEARTFTLMFNLCIKMFRLDDLQPLFADMAKYGISSQDLLRNTSPLLVTNSPSSSLDPCPAIAVPFSIKEQKKADLQQFYRANEVTDHAVLPYDYDTSTPIEINSNDPEALREQELKLETQALARAVEQYRRTVAMLEAIGKATELKPSQRLIAHWFPALCDAILAKQDAILKKPVTEPWEALLLLLPPNKLAVVTIHAVLAPIQAQGVIPFVQTCANLGRQIESEVGFMRLRKEKPGLVKYLGKDPATGAVERAVRRAFSNEEVWPKGVVIQLGGELLHTLLQTATVPPDPKEKRSTAVLGEMLPAARSVSNREELPKLISRMTSAHSWQSYKEAQASPTKEREKAFKHTYTYTTKRKVGAITCAPSVLQTIRDGHLAQEANHARMLPMVVPPKPWTAPDVGGYLVVKSNVMRVRDSRLQWDMLSKTGTDLSNVYRSLDELSAVPWKINKRVLRVAQELWQRGGGIGDLPSRTDLPLPEAPDNYKDMDPAERSAYYRHLRRQQRANADLHSLRCDTTLKLGVAEQFQNLDRFYFPHNMDFRGRTYPIPPHLNHLGSDLCRGLLCFSEGRELGPNGLGWLKVQLANLFGNNKCSFADRQRFADENMARVLATAADPAAETWWHAADDPWQALSTCYELTDALASPDPARHVSYLPIHMDGSCNGLQHYAALGGDEEGARKVNLLPAPQPDDVYSGVATIVSRLVEEDAQKGHSIALLLRDRISRRIVKQTVMTSVYGVTYVGARAQIQNALSSTDLLDDDAAWQASRYLAAHTLEAVREMFVGAREIMAWLATCAGLIAQSGEPVMWTTPLGLPVVQPYRRPGKQFVQTVVQKVTLQESSDDLPIHVTRQRTAHPPNFIHSLDSTHMMLTCLEMADQGYTFASVHDSYWTHACTVDPMNQILRQKFVDMHSEPLLENLLASFRRNYPNVDFPDVPKSHDLDLSQVLES
eukprot:CAMPEP_0174230974 /NCGR_PEP_ID=MMETSP0417-20130205/1603_1 /TAXON_ID=242541 /ORGANISM="Mayorella sp, Strain BSH-02190019" /LENGTH=1235 /DNA_ID=CAMNT_0015308757 /DNA_START=120 /DNA_END=3824 /DNA_ORIENTATION=+